MSRKPSKHAACKVCHYSTRHVFTTLLTCYRLAHADKDPDYSQLDLFFKAFSSREF